MEANTEFATSLHGDVYQRIPGENNLWTLIQANHSLGSALGERFHRVKRLGTGTDTDLFCRAGRPAIPREGDDHADSDTDISCLSEMGKGGVS